MTTWFHMMILATCAVATIAVGMAGAAVLSDTRVHIAKKQDRLMTVADASARPEITIEQRTDGMSILTRVPAPVAN
ncbi:hypothetical protein SAMN02745157_3432 [Kaistia soli DSM 19436]|uniref:Uncharacterized protein n=1 Tax=Kaistia soli DSM 19436 TaxID=1122133 RepID=A0A1M5GJN6_9HYPH|nr:hypothetical protein [Kaistia soli]SHG03918.1 hypothetical protein SAMN02745157_3432 [Kaistia soli DSM 19436]